MIFAQIESVPAEALKNYCLITLSIIGAGYYLKGIFFPDKPAAMPQPLTVAGTPPGNDVLSRDMKSINHRVKSLEDWRSTMGTQMDENKTEILVAGEERARRIYEHIDELRADNTRNFQDMERAIGRLEGKLEK